MPEPNVQFVACFYDFMLHNAFVLQQQESLEFDFGINSNSDVDIIHKWLCKHPHIEMKCCNSIHKTYLGIPLDNFANALCEISQPQNAFDAERSLVTRKWMGIKKKIKKKWLNCKFQDCTFSLIKTVSFWNCFSLSLNCKQTGIHASEVGINSSASHGTFDSHNFSSHRSECFLVMQIDSLCKSSKWIILISHLVKMEVARTVLSA